MIRCSKCGRIAVSDFCCGQRVETIGAALVRIRNSAKKNAKQIVNQEIQAGKTVDLSKKGFSSFSEISELFTLNERKQIETLWLSGNKIKNLDGLDLFPNVTVLAMDSNELNDISNLPKRNWKELNFENNLISEIPHSFYSVINSIDLSKFDKYHCVFTLYLAGNPLIDNGWSESIDLEKILSRWYTSDTKGEHFPTLYLGPIDEKLSTLFSDVSIGDERGYISEVQDQQSYETLRELCGIKTFSLLMQLKSIFKR